VKKSFNELGSTIKGIFKQDKKMACREAIVIS